MTPEQKEAAWNAYQTFPIDMCADHDDEYRKAVIAAVEAALAASQPAPAADTGQVVTWDVGAQESDERTWLTLRRSDGASAMLSCKSKIDCGNETIVSQVIKAFAADYTHPAPLDAERVREDDNLGQRCADILQWKKTGVCPDGPLRDLANSPRIQEIHGVGSMRAAEELTLVEAAEVVAALRQKEGKA